MNPGNFLLPLPSDLETYFGSSTADLPGTSNLAGVKDPVLDALIEAVRRAQTMDQLHDASRAFDRVLRSRHYVVPSGTRMTNYFAHWNYIELPSRRPAYFTIDDADFHPLIWPVIASWMRPDRTASASSK
jgi:microcin C transport system substrate-binding protein